MPKLRTHHVFISHAWTYNADYYKLEKRLDAAKRFAWRNYSVPEHDQKDTRNDAQLEQALRRQIERAKVVIVISGMYVNHRIWIQSEIDIAVELGKPIIGIKPRGAEKTPTEVQAVAQMFPWSDTSKIIEAIRNPAGPKYLRKDAEVPPKVETSVLYDWIQDNDGLNNYDVYVSGETVKMRGGMGG